MQSSPRFTLRAHLKLFASKVQSQALALKSHWRWPQNEFLRHGLGFTLLFIACGSVLSSAGFGFRGSQLLTELPLLLAAYLPLIVCMRPHRLRIVAAAAPVVTLYLIHHLYLLHFKRLPQWREFGMVDQLLPFVPTVVHALLLLGPLLWLGHVVYHLDHSRRWRWAGLLLLPLFVGTTVGMAPEKSFKAARKHLGFVAWSDHYNVRYHGAVFSSLVREARTRAAIAALPKDPDEKKMKRYADPWLQENLQKRNVHVIVLEGFFDPRQLQGAKFSESPIHPSFDAFFGQPTDASIAPGVASGTARSEFELLCGVPALGRYGPVEFQLFTGAKTYCLPEILSRQGYVTRGQHAFNKNMYNRYLAYPGVGFGDSYFIDYGNDGSVEIHGIPALSPRAHDELTDPAFYDYVLKRLQERPKDAPPIFNYMLTMFGHYPYRMGPFMPQEHIRMEPQDEAVQTMANQVYHRSKALVDFTQRLIAVDPQSLIVILSDHLPPMPPDQSRYKDFNLRANHSGDAPEKMRETFVAMIDKGERQNLGLIRHCQLYGLILDHLSEGRYCDNFSCTCGSPSKAADKDELNDYTVIVSLGTRPEAQNPNLAHVFPR